MKIIEMYQTADGKTFDSEQQAKRHETDILCNKVENFIEGYFVGSHHRPSIIRSVNVMIEDKELLKSQLKELLYILEN